MPKADPLVKILKQMNALQSKAEKIVSDLSALTDSLTALQTKVEVPPVNKVIKQKAITKSSNSENATTVAKKRGRPRKNS
jgi:hypothetical protein